MFKGRNDWFEVWYYDKKCIIATMVRNMVADLDAGYDYFGRCITMEREEIEAYNKEFDAQLEAFKSMDENAVNRWCYYDMVKRGAIEP